MKKLLSIVMVFALSVGVLSGCGSSGSDTEETTTGVSTVEVIV